MFHKIEAKFRLKTFQSAKKIILIIFSKRGLKFSGIEDRSWLILSPQCCIINIGYCNRNTPPAFNSSLPRPFWIGGRGGSTDIDASQVLTEEGNFFQRWVKSKNMRRNTEFLITYVELAFSNSNQTTANFL